MNKHAKNLKDAHSFYVERGENRAEVLYQTNIYTDIAEKYIKFLIDKVFSGYDVELSRGMSLGVLGVRGRKVIPKLNKDGEIVGLIPDWKKTKELWESNPIAKEAKEIVYHMNEHTSGIRYTINWFKKGMTTENSGLYNLSITKGPNGNRRKLSKKIKTGKTEFIVNK